MEYKDSIKDYSNYTNIIKNLSDSQAQILLNHWNRDAFHIPIESLKDSDIVPGIKIYAGESEGIRMTWHIYKITYIRSGVVFYKRDNSKREQFFTLGCIAQRWMFPTKVYFGNHSGIKMQAYCECPLVTEYTGKFPIE